MTGSGGMGTMPSSRLTRLLEEKAEALRKRRKTSDAASELAEGRVRLLAEVGIELPETASRKETIREWQRKSDWDAAEVAAQSLTVYLDENAPPALLAKRDELFDRTGRLQAAGIPFPAELDGLAPQVRELTFRTDLTAEATTLARYAALVRSAQTDVANRAREQVLAVAHWAGLSDDEARVVDERLTELLPKVDGNASADWLERLEQALPTLIPTAASHRDRSRSEGDALIALGRDIGFPTIALDEAMAADGRATPTRWVESVPELERQSAGVEGELRNRVTQILGYLSTTLNSLREHGADPGEAIQEIDRMRAQIDPAGVLELGPLLQRARSVAEEPIVAVVAGLLDEVRPKLVEARELGRDPSEVFASMNRAREALRLKIYSEALAASVEAIDRVSQLTSDLDAAREEAEALGRLLGRLESLSVSMAPFRAALSDVTVALERFEIDRARTTLRETVRALGRETARYFGAELQRLTSAVDVARQRGFLPSEVPEELDRARHHLDAGALPEAGEALARADVALRAAAGPYIARRVDEMRNGFEEVRDPDLSIATLRSLADADIALRVKEDLSQSLESLRQAEREFSAAFASESSSLLEALEERQRILEEMGGAGAEFLRQTDEIQQIFDMGDFVKCARSAREFLASTEEVQKSRAEGGISFAKLDLIELDRFGVRKDDLAKRFEAAQADLAAGRLVEAYRGGTTVHADAQKVVSAARAATALLIEAKQRLLQIEQAGTDSLAFQPQIAAAEKSFRALDFDGVDTHLARLRDELDAAARSAEVQRILGEAQQLSEDATRLGIPIEGLAAKFDEARAALSQSKGSEALALARAAHQDLIRTLLPVLEENLKSVEEDFEIARRSGVELDPMAGLLAEASERIALPVPLGVAERIESARTQLSQTRGLVEHAERSAKRVEEAFGQAELLKLSTPAMRSRVDAVEHQLRDRLFARTIEMAGPLEQEILHTTTQHLTRTIAGLQGLVVRARQDGVPTAAAENLLARAKEALHAGRPMEALQLAAQSEGEVERVGLQNRVALGALEALDAKFARLADEGVRSPNAAVVVAEARRAFDQKDFSRVLEISVDAIDQIAQARESYRKSREALEAATEAVGEAVAVGVEPAEVATSLQKARDLEEVGDYAAAVARAREVTDLSGWAIERRYAGSIAEVRGLLLTARSEGVPGAETVTASLAQAETFLQEKKWTLAREALERSQTEAFQALDQSVVARVAELDARRRELGEVLPDELDRRSRWAANLEEARARHAYAEVIASIESEVALGMESRKSALEQSVSELKDRLWVGERLGLDTTPAMERFSEARMALDQGRLDAVGPEVDQGNTALEGLIRAGISTRSKQVETELLFARDGLRVRLGDVESRLTSVATKVEEGHLVEAGRTLLAVEEELNQRKGAHRQLMNLHYLIEAALRRAAEAHLDAGEARRLFDDSARDSASDYAGAIAKARASLKLVEGLLKASEPPTAFWPFKRPAADPPG